MPVVPAYGDPPPPVAIQAAADALAGGDIVGMPTDTIYGLAADPFHTGASDRLFRVKGRPRAVELPVLVADADQAMDLCASVPPSAVRLMERYWPGPLTLVLPRRPGLAADLGEEDATIGIRCPAHPVPLAVCRAVGPIATTSANRHGEPPLVTAQEVADGFAGQVAVVLDGGLGSQGASTVIDVRGPEPLLLRDGAVPWAAVVAAAR